MTQITDEAAKSLGLFNEALEKAINTISTMAPKAWHAMVSFERIDGISSLISNFGFILAFAIASYVGFRFAKMHKSKMKALGEATELYGTKLESYNDYEGNLIGCTILAVVALLASLAIFFTCVPDNMVRVVYPDIIVAQKMINKVVN